MELSYPSLEGLNTPAKYSGPLRVLSYLDVTQKGYLTRYPCGHKAARCTVIRPPKTLYKALARRDLLATVGVFENVVVFDLNRMQRVAGHRERELCPRCFFSRLFAELDPTCPICGMRIRHGSKVWLMRYSSFALAEKCKVKSLKVKHDSIIWAMVCCEAGNVDTRLKQVYVWDGRSRSLNRA